MKKLLTITALIFLFLSCDKEETECTCKQAKFQLTTGQPNQYFYMSGVPMDCNTKRPTQEAYKKFPSNYLFVKCND